jgi:hypothetical protein
MPDDALQRSLSTVKALKWKFFVFKMELPGEE